MVAQSEQWKDHELQNCGLCVPCFRASRRTKRPTQPAI